MAFEKDLFSDVTKSEIIELFKHAMIKSTVNNMIHESIYPKAIQTRNLRLLRILEELFDGSIVKQLDSIIKYEYIELFNLFKPTFDRYKDSIEGASLNYHLASAIFRRNKPHLFYLVDPAGFNEDDICGLKYVISDLQLNVEQYKYMYRVLPQVLKSQLPIYDVEVYANLKKLGYNFSILNLIYLRCNSPKEVKEIIDECYAGRFVVLSDLKAIRLDNRVNYLVMCMCMRYIIVDEMIKNELTWIFGNICTNMIKHYDPAIHNFKLFMFTVGRHCNIAYIHSEIYRNVKHHTKRLDLYKQLLLTELKLRVALKQSEKDQIYMQHAMSANYPLWVAYNSYSVELGDEVGLEESKIVVIPDEI
jgi:hypothetical protein